MPPLEDRRKQQHRQRLQQLGVQLRKLAEQQQLRALCLEHEKVLCDLVLHQQLFLKLRQQHPWQQPQGRQQQPQQQQCQVVQSLAHQASDIHKHHLYTGRLPHTCALCADLQTSRQQGQQQQQQQEEVEEKQRLHALQQQMLPDSYVSHLMLGATQQQVLQVTAMSPADWLEHFVALFPQLASLLESVQRGDILAAAKQSTTVSSLAAGAAAGGGQGATAASTLCSAESTNNGCDSGTPGVASSAASISSSSLLSRMFLGKDGSCVGLCPMLDLLQLLELQSRTATLLMLACGLNHEPLFAAGSSCYSPGVEVTDKPLHWKMVVDKMQLSEMQMLHLSLYLKEYKRSSAALQAQGSVLVEQVAAPSLQAQVIEQLRGFFCNGGSSRSQVVLNGSGATASGSNMHNSSNNNRLGGAATQFSSEQQSTQAQHQQLQHQRSCTSVHSQPEAVGSDSTVQDASCADQQLQRFMLRRLSNLFITSAGIINTLSAYQQAVMIVASFPFIPSLMSVAQVAADQLQKIQQLRLESVEQQVVAQGLGDYDTPGAQLAARVAAAVPAGHEVLQGTARSSNSSSTQIEPGKDSILQAVIGQDQQLRLEQLERHREWCWAALGCVSQPGDTEMQGM